jgi:hypothetical protein
MNDNQPTKHPSGKPLPLTPGAQSCIGCGFCCKVCACPFGVWDEKRRQCAYLKKADKGRFDCTIYEKIINRPVSSWFVAPAFGAGCCSSLNPDRQRLLKRMAKK